MDGDQPRRALRFELHDYHYYEPESGHGLAQNPLNAIIGPRPIGWVSSRSCDGTLNLTPYSFFSAFNHQPPIIGFSSAGAKDSIRNILQTGEFVWNLATEALAERMNLTGTAVPYGASEFKLAGLTPLRSRRVAAPRVAESPVNFECKLTEVVPLRNRNRTHTHAWLVLGEVVGVHIRMELLKGGLFDTFGAGIILRAGGASSYARISRDNRFDMRCPEFADRPSGA